MARSRGGSRRKYYWFAGGAVVGIFLAVFTAVGAKVAGVFKK